MTGVATIIIITTTTTLPPILVVDAWVDLRRVVVSLLDVHNWVGIRIVRRIRPQEGAPQDQQQRHHEYRFHDEPRRHRSTPTTLPVTVRRAAAATATMSSIGVAVMVDGTHTGGRSARTVLRTGSLPTRSSTRIPHPRHHTT